MNKLVVYAALLSCIFVTILLVQPAQAKQSVAPLTTIAAGGCTPNKGGPGTTIHCQGEQTYFDVGVYIGTPDPDSSPIATMHPDKNGNWSVVFTMPRTLSSGLPIPAGTIYLVLPGMNNDKDEFQFSRAPLPATGENSGQWPIWEIAVAACCIVAGVCPKVVTRQSQVR